MRAGSVLAVFALGVCFAGCPPKDVEGGWVEILNQSGDFINQVDITYRGPLVDTFIEIYDLENDKIAPGASRKFRLRFDGLYQVNTRLDDGTRDFNDIPTYFENGITVVLPIPGD